MSSVLAPDDAMLSSGADTESPIDWILATTDVRPETIPPGLLDRARKISKQASENSVERTVLLGIVLAEMRGVSFADVAGVLKVPEKKLERFMHGEEMPPTGRLDHWTCVAQILENLHKVIDKRATSRWLNTRIAALEDRTPLECISRGQERRVLDLTLTYLDPSFS